MKERILLAGYLLFVVALTLLHDPAILALFALLLLLFSGRKAPHILKRSLLPVALFTGTVSLAYIVQSLILGRPWESYILMINLRVLSLSLSTTLFLDRVNLIRTLSFSPSLSYFLVITYSQILAYGRIFQEFRMAFTSRTVGMPSHRDRIRFSGAVLGFFARKALADSRDIALAMRSRGCFHD